MEFTDQELAQLEAYYMGSLSPEDRLGLEIRMKKEKDFGESAEEFLQTLGALENAKMKAFQLHLRMQHQLQPKTNLVYWMKFMKVGRWAAALLVLGVAIWGMKGEIWPEQQSAIVSFAETEFVPYPSVFQNMQDKKPDGMELYANKQYKEAKVKLLIELDGSSQKDSTKLFYLSMCYIADKEPQKAIPILEAMIDTQFAPIETEWYLALAYILSDNKVRAIPLLEKTARGSTMHKEKAIEALKIIKN